MTKFALLADIHEQLRLGESPVKQLARLEKLEDTLALHRLFYIDQLPYRTDPFKLITYEATSFYDVVKDMLPEEEAWMTLASESANSGSRDFDLAYVEALLQSATTFTEVAHKFNEKEARLLWRWCLRDKPVITKRAFFGALARIHAVPHEVVTRNMTSTTIVKLFRDKESLRANKRWTEYDWFPSPMRWKAYTSLAPPEENHLAVVVPKGDIVYLHNHVVRDRMGRRIGKHGYSANYLYEAVRCPDSGVETIIDRVKKHSPLETFATRVEGEHGSGYMSTDSDWDDIVRRLQSPDVSCIRLIKPSQEFKPDAIGGYVMHADRTKVFLKIEYLTGGEYLLGALDGIDDVVCVTDAHPLPEELQNPLDIECAVAEIAAVQVGIRNHSLFLYDWTVIKLRADLGIKDVTQYVELLARSGVE